MIGNMDMNAAPCPDVPHARDRREIQATGAEAGGVVCKNVGDDSLDSVIVQQRLVAELSGQDFDTTSSELRKRFEIVEIGFARFQDHIAVQFRNESAFQRDPAVIG